jgi:hypothetical protein
MGAAVLSFPEQIPASALEASRTLQPSFTLERFAGRLIELSALGASAASSFTFLLVHQAQRAGEPVAWVLLGEPEGQSRALRARAALRTQRRMHALGALCRLRASMAQKRNGQGAAAARTAGSADVRVSVRQTDGRCRVSGERPIAA